ncbi:MAG: Rpn family recombination-promoting nuclease/putative transposase, partial [Thermodesulfobacteriota bacterium]
MEHDGGYKHLFSHPEMIADLLRGFVREEWVSQLDFSTLERVSGSYVTDDLRQREDDLIWRLRWGKGWLFVYLLIEFQSSVDRFMAVRIMAYLALLYQDIIRQGWLTTAGLLPPVLPVVLYNGDPRWSAATSIQDLITEVPGGLAAYRPEVRYLLLDEGRYSEADLAPLRNLVAALFRLENSRTPEDIRGVLEHLIAWLAAPEQARIRRAFTVWMRRVLLP